jgi:hypothetical protein
MSGLTNAELESIRTAIEELLPDTCTVLSVTRTSDGQGGWAETWGTVTASLACRIDPAKPGTQAQFGASVQPFQGYVMTVNHAGTITTANRVLKDGYTFEVVSVDFAKSWDGSRRVYLERL